MWWTLKIKLKSSKIYHGKVPRIFFKRTAWFQWWGNHLVFLWLFSEKDLKRDAKEEDTARPKRQRGRPRKVKIINDDLMPNSDNNDDDSSSESESEGDELSEYTSWFINQYHYHLSKKGL